MCSSGVFVVVAPRIRDWDGPTGATPFALENQMLELNSIQPLDFAVNNEHKLRFSNYKRVKKFTPRIFNLKKPNEVI